MPTLPAVERRIESKMKDIRQNIGKNIVRLRTAAHLTQAQFAEQLNYTDKAVSKWERGESVPDIVALKQIADQFSVTVDYLLQEHRADEPLKVSQEITIRRRNHLIITLMAIVIVWFLAVFVFFLGASVSGRNLWQAYLVAVPVSAVVALVFNSIWGKGKWNYIIISILIWSTLLTLYILLLQYNLLTIFLLGIPGQTSVILWSRLRLGRQNKLPSTTKSEKKKKDKQNTSQNATDTASCL